ncbi:D-sedoheptulose 7-phosphate isomerase [Methanococcus maripaludis]|uniref:Probable phosphoheptose isomerase n=1 Tax=Methanococcus maripaludis TaxID=39152 RepID=A0A2L1CCQ9_METMI|nr:D-sedoheptulose 7-phosphate isomerase [Methanococcus maripaludis]AVB77141.1 Phosphoheptose isomerase 1 [Methanococcus maripaludis]MBA2863652.1 D-sedoheptulose 7-phosphate isomerase [Methanococcus maripaludis]MBB6496342.1 D-sedoheptulose 7-phosphate isomerase [Methanococcus maripaludis]
MKTYFEESSKVKLDFISKNEHKLIDAINIIVNALKNGNKILICGNGGSAADSQHFAAEIVGRYKLKRKGYPAIALSTDTSILTAIGNDYGFEKIFERQVEALGTVGDILIGISTSGNSENVINAVNLAKNKGLYTIGLLGKDGGKLNNLVDIPLIVPSNNTPRVQECHLTIYHVICEEVEKKLM